MLKISDVIIWLEDLKEDFPNLMIFPYMRVSTQEQRTGGNLKNREVELRRRLAVKGLVCHERRNTEQVNGASFDSRPGLQKAIARARNWQRDHSGRIAVVVTDAVNRFVRGRYYKGTPETDIPDPEQLKELTDMAGNMILATLLVPTSSFESVRRYENRCAKLAGKQYGRPRKPRKSKADRSKMIQEAQRLRIEERLSGYKIAAQLNVKPRTIYYWLKAKHNSGKESDCDPKKR